MLADIWAQVLDINQVGRHDNFFELGGDSVRSIQIIAQAQEAGLHLTPQDIFQHQTVAELALVAQPCPAGDSATLDQAIGVVDPLEYLDQDELDRAIGQVEFDEG
jgi:aryl carrier-like protein